MEEKKEEEKSEDVQVQSDNHHEPEQEEKLGQGNTSQEGTGASKKLWSLIANKKETDLQLTLAKKECEELHGKQEKIKGKLRNLKEQRETLLIENATLKEEKRIREMELQVTLEKNKSLEKEFGEIRERLEKLEKKQGAECGVMACRPESDSSILDRADCMKRPIMNQPRETDLLLVGKKGNGKSATGNSILRHKDSKPFKTRASSTSVTTVVSAEITEYNGRLIRVVDSPGVGNTRAGDLDISLEGLQKAIQLNDRGYHAFLLVVRFGGRFTEEDINTVELLKGYFGGPTILKNYCILVFTCGDNFEDETEDSGQTFKEWCNSQDGILKKLIDDCNGRVILFDNRTKDKAKQSKQLDELLKTVDTLPMQGRRYCAEQFQLAKEGRERAIVNLQKPQIEKEMMEKTSLIIQKLNNLGTTDDPKNNRGPLNELKKQLDTLYESIKSRDKQTGALHDMIEATEGLRRAVYFRAETCEGMITMSEKRDVERQIIKRELDKIRRHHEMQLKAVEVKDQECRLS